MISLLVTIVWLIILVWCIRTTADKGYGGLVGALLGLFLPVLGWVVVWLLPYHAAPEWPVTSREPGPGR